MNIPKEQVNTRSLGISLIRIHFGIILFAHGWLKVYVFGIGGTVGYFASLGLPSMITYLVIFGELFGGLALILGIQSRLAAMLAIPIVFGACFFSFDNGWVHSAVGGGWEYAASLTVISLALVLMGSGRYISLNWNPLDKVLPGFLRD